MNTESVLGLGNFSVSLAVKNLTASRAFYEALGFEMVLRSDHGPTGASSDPLAYYLKPLT